MVSHLYTWQESHTHHIPEPSIPSPNFVRIPWLYVEPHLSPKQPSGLLPKCRIVFWVLVQVQMHRRVSADVPVAARSVLANVVSRIECE